MEYNARKAMVIFNATAGTGKAQAAEDDVIDALVSAGYEIRTSRILPGENDMTGDEFPDDSGLVVSCGGDGTFNQITNKYLGRESLPKFAYIPCGNTNVIASSLGIPEDSAEAINAAINGQPYKFDAGKVNDRYFNFVASFISESSLNFVTSQQMKTVFSYSKYILKATGELYMSIADSFHMKIETDAGVFEDDYIIGAVSNLSEIDRKYIADDSLKNNDGVMELFLIKKPGSREEAKEVLNVLQEGRTDHPLMVMTRITKATFISDSDIAWSLDGEYYGTQNETRLEVLKEALTISGASTQLQPQKT